jgi:hypothetical protein
MKFRIFKSEILRRFTKLIGYVNIFIIYSKLIKNKKNDNFLIPPPPVLWTKIFGKSLIFIELQINKNQENNIVLKFIKN